MCGIFAYINYSVNRERRYVLQVLFNGLRRLEYRGYDSAGVSIDESSDSNAAEPSLLVFRQEGNIESLVKSVYQGSEILILLISSILFVSMEYALLGNNNRFTFSGPTLLTSFFFPISLVFNFYM